MKDRIEKLEVGQASILTKLDAIATAIADGRLDNEKRFSGFDKSLTKLEAQLDHTATAAALASGYGDLNGKIEKVDGRLSNIPTTWQTIAIIVAMLVGIAGVSFTISGLREPARQATAVVSAPAPAPAPAAPPVIAPASPPAKAP